MTRLSAWLTRQRQGLVLCYRPHSRAAQDADDLLRHCGESLAAVAEALGVDPFDLPTLVVYLSDPATGPAETAAAALPETGWPRLEVRTTYTSETHPAAPEVELCRAVLQHLLGPASKTARFWDEGLAGYLVAQTGRSPDYSGAAEHCRLLLADGLLPPIEELVAESGERVSAIASVAACAFAQHVIERHGLESYRALLRAARRHESAAFSEVYREPLAVTDRDWRRQLEASAGGEAPSTITVLRWLVPLARPYWPAGLGILGYTIIGLAFSLALPLSFRFLVDNILARRPLQEAIPFVGPRGHVIRAGAEQIESLIALLTFLGVLYVLAAGARLRLNRLLNQVGETFVLELRRRLLERVARLPSPSFAHWPTADFVHRIVQDAASVQQMLTVGLVPMVSSLLSILVYAALLISLQARLALVALLGLPLLGLIHRLRRRSLRAAARERVRRVSDLSARVAEFAEAHALVKIYGAATALLQRLDLRLGVHHQLNVAYAQESSLLTQVGGLIVHLTQVAVLLVGGYLVVVSDGHELATGGLVAFYVLLNQLFGPVAQLANSRQSLTGTAASVERVVELLEQSIEQDPPDAVEVGPLRERLRFEDVTFGYGGRPVLRDLSLTIPAGATVAFVGPTGAGKSSVVQLLPRLYEPQRGRITWDGVELGSVRLASLRAQVLLVPQEHLLLGTTLYENIRFGLDGVSDEDVHRAARLARAHDFISALPDGYDTVLGERGVGLSGGQRQRIALARALLRRPSVLVLDEATSALDATTQRAVQEGLREAGDGRTLVKIAHRLETVADADLIYVLDDGRLVEQGTHAELLARGGVYARLFEDQVGTLPNVPRPSPRQAARWLARLAPFCDLPAAGLEALASSLVLTSRRAGELVYERGGEPDELFVVGRGRVELLAFDETGHERIVNTLGAGAAVGDVGFLRGTPHAASVRAATDVLLYSLRWEAYEALLAQAPDRSTPPVEAST